MTSSTYDQFVAKFKDTLLEVADFDSGDNTATLDVILHCFVKSGLKELLSSHDVSVSAPSASKETVAQKSENGTEAPAKRATRARKSAEGGTSKRASAESESPSTTETATTKTKRVTAYNLFIAQKVRDDHVPMKEAASEWKKLSDEDKQVFIKKAEEANRSSAGTGSA